MMANTGAGMKPNSFAADRGTAFGFTGMPFSFHPGTAFSLARNTHT
jgi:hypothetical protein